MGPAQYIIRTTILSWNSRYSKGKIKCNVICHSWRLKRSYFSRCQASTFVRYIRIQSSIFHVEQLRSNKNQINSVKGCIASINSSLEAGTYESAPIKDKNRRVAQKSYKNSQYTFQCGNVAASGGYYIAGFCRLKSLRIPRTLNWSIGGLWSIVNLVETIWKDSIWRHNH